MLPYSASDHCRSPPPRAAFSSSLLPSAAPFPAADPAPHGPSRDLPTAPSVYAAAAGDWGNVSWIEPPMSYMAPVAAPSAATPGYKDDGPHSTPYGVYSRNHYSDFPGLQSTRSESSNLLSEKHPGTCQENSEALCNGVGPSVFNQQQNSTQNSTVSELLDHSDAEGTGPCPPRQDLNQCPFGSSYDNYVTQLPSCSTDIQPHIFSAQYVSSSETAKRTAPVMSGTTGESSFSSSSYMNPCRINLDYFDCVWNEQKDIGYQTTDNQYGKWSDSLDDMAPAANYQLNPLGGNCPGVERLGNGRHMQESSETKQDMGNFISKFSSSEIGFLQPREFSSELLEVNNTFVDSPCWKGTPTTYPSPFGIMENKDAPHTVIGTVGYSSSYQSQKAPELNFVYPARFPECQEVSGSENDLSKVFKLPVRFEINDLGVPPVRVYPDVTSHATYSPNKQHARTSFDPVEDSKNVIILSQHESSCCHSKTKLLDEHSGSHAGSMTEAINVEVSNPIVTTTKLNADNLTNGNPHGNSSAAVGKVESTQKRGEDISQCYPGAEGIMLNMSSDSSSSTRAIILKLMHNLSVALLSTCKDGSVFPDDEEEILQSVIQNLTAASSKRSKIEQKIDDGLSNSRQMKFKNINCLNNSFWMAMHEHSTSESDLEFKTAISQVLTGLPEDKILDDSKVSEASVYKNLWIETEASACKLKYELQLARMKLATMKGHNNTLKVSYLSEGSKGSNSSTTSNKPQSPVKESTAPLQHHLGYTGNRSTVNGVDDDVFAQLKVLQSRTDNATSFGEFDCEGQQEANKKPYEVEDAVLARLKVLKSRPDNVTSLSRQSMPDARTNRDDVVDDAVMARLRILKSRPDNVTSMCGVSKEHEEACDDQLNRDGVEVMSSKHIVAKFVQPSDLANRLVRNDLTGGLDFVDGTCSRENSKASGSADEASTKSCDAPSEETSNKDAVHGEDNPGGNRVWPQAAGDSNVWAEGSQEVHLNSAPVSQYGSSPSEWEHVLKENFFHPGE